MSKVRKHDTLTELGRTAREGTQETSNGLGGPRAGSSVLQGWWAKRAVRAEEERSWRDSTGTT